MRSVATALAMLCLAGSAAARRSCRVQEESRTLDEIYAAAVAEGGQLVIYAGGDIDSQQAGVRSAFQARFPDVNLTIVVDYSKMHDVRLETQFAEGDVVPDVVQLQTLFDFTRWAREGRLLPYKPIGFSNIHPVFRDEAGYSTAVMVLAFSYYCGAIPGTVPSVEDLVQPEWRGKIASSYPNDDDAVTFLYKKYVDAFGYDWLAALAEQDVAFRRGSHSAGGLANAGEYTVGVGSSGSLLLETPASFIVPTEEPFVAWGQRAAILKSARYPEAAKLYMSWMLSEEKQQASYNGWSVRTDVQPQGGLAPVWDYPNSNVWAFPRFMADREEVEIWRNKFTLFFGDVAGEPTPGRLGLRPGAGEEA